ncbi:MAG: helicase [Microcoleus sp. PH2017_10_PVI_O_A]|uniref:helicase-related protein n=1 Tax=unclassified Microcoleus TaxID=2642155 RepID=UPI001D6A9643|nr:MULTISPECIES: helicase-related protein [unclassified Microcoleus]TAE80009.1 MAG: helicase [Oscillatoriales cyanobacterium]MCC3407798.1 helicase [Microcoleus sp. PH2017_10_PVI_O_A]MCC3461958.1 helicase [Microcoleus sp. PH2017_11_PCY_U_A]MCC3480418.1 helicase [Microcoleus sp. PH2017_12_PCY_D_A]MCC3530212.1 helicase [Microcoleus sp. PH2017_21_RUC_O_A]
MISEDFGRLFEVGFNIGILAYIQKEKLAHNFGDSYRLDLQQLKLPKMMAEMIGEAKLLASLDAEIAEKWSLFFVQKGFLGGLNFFREYIKSTGWTLGRLEIVYCQCNFSNENSIRTYNKDEKKVFKQLLSQLTTARISLLDDRINSYIRRYSKKGEFLQADTLMLLRYENDFRILCVDLSVFSPTLAPKPEDINEIEVIRKYLLREISYLRSKSVFSNLRMDTSTLGVDFSEDLKGYFTAFKYKDKESTKLIQAGSYAHSFYGFLQQTGILGKDAEVLFNVVGYGDRNISTISLGQDKLKLLATCAEIYQKEITNKEISDSRTEVLGVIELNAARSFKEGRKFVDSLLAIEKSLTQPVCHTERIDNFVNSIDIISDKLADELQIDRGLHLRNAHAQLIVKALQSDETYIFLTGNPGIGKTTAIANFLKTHIDDGFLFLYVSPRKQVNLDIIEKFKDKNTGLLCDNRLFCINTNSDIIASYSGKRTVKYNSNSHDENFAQKTVNFLKDNPENKVKEYHQREIARKNETVIEPASLKTMGVLNSICNGIYSLINCKTSNNIVATVSIQSLRMKENRQSTLDYLEQIFQDTYNKRDKRVITSKMQEISSRIKHIFIMIDEITGDDGGVEFLAGIAKMVKNHELHNPQHGFNTKIIVADASIVDPDVIKQHLENTSPEPDKIYFKKLARNSDVIEPLQVTPFEFKRLAATVINANSYPARSLEITYKVFVETVKYNEDASLKENYDLVKRVQSEIIQDINQRLAQPGVEQIIVYIQNKQRLAELIEKIQKEREFNQFEDYLEIHANISEEEKQKIQECKDTAKVIFMTASGSRGLSFPKTKHILVDIAHFQIEKNLMEVIQVIYRGRGEDKQGKTLDGEDKELVFYVSDTAVYYADDAELSLQESKLSLLNLLLILKTAVMTRILGYGYLGREKFVMIPIGGKSVSAVGDTFSNKMASLIKTLKSESYRGDKLLKEVYTSLEELLARGEFVLTNSDNSRQKGDSYLEMRDDFNKKFLEKCNPLDGLLSYDHLEIGHICGSLLVVPLANQNLLEKYQMRLREQIQKCRDNGLLQKMRLIRDSKSYPENVRSAITGGAIELLQFLNGDVEKTQYFEQLSQQFDRYYAIPLFAFVSGEEMQEYFADSSLEEPEDRQFREILSAYMRAMYPVDSVMPIGHKYQDFPFIVFRSYSLEQSRAKMFTDKYLLSSNELNVLNLILSKDAN